jgi:predicted nucleic acid-binding protein
MTLILDTSILIDLEKGEKVTIEKLKNLAQLYPIPAEITFVTEFEFILGIKKRNPKNKEKALAFLNNFSVFHTTSKTASILANLKEKYDRKGLPLPLADLLISALAIENTRILVTKDKDFENIEELKKIVLR